MQDVQELLRHAIGGCGRLIGFVGIRFLVGIGLGNQIGSVRGERNAAQPHTRQDGQTCRYGYTQ